MQCLSLLMVLMSWLAASATGTYLWEPANLDSAGKNDPSDSIAVPLRPLELHPNSPLRLLPEMQILPDRQVRIKTR